MAIQTATNPQTGETVVLVNGQWLPSGQTATNDKGEKAYFVNNQWITDTPTRPAPTDRTVGEAFKDVGAGVVSGVGSLVQLPGQLYGLATGDFSKTGSLGLGEDISKYGEEMKSEGLKAREAERAAKVQEAEKEGQFAAFKAGFGETITDPALLTSFLAEQVPNILPMILTGGATAALTAGRASAAALAKGATKEAAADAAKIAAAKAGTTAAIQTGAVMQGADVGAGAYDEIYKELRAKGMSEEQAAAETINKARAAGLAGYGLSVLANRYLPGGKALEEVLAGKKLTGSRLGTGAVTGIKEIPGENIEEVGGRVAQNIAAQQAGLDRELMAGTGETAAMATLGAAGMGGGAGLLAGRAPTKDIPAAVDQTTDTTQQQDQTTDTTQQPATKQPETDLFKELILGEKTATPAEPTTVEELRAAYEAGVVREAELRNKPKGTKTREEQVELQALHQKNRALKKKLDDALAQTTTQGATDVAGTQQPAGGTSPVVPTQPTPKLPTTEGTVSSERDGMVSAGSDVAVPATREAGEPVAVTPPATPLTAPVTPSTTGETLGTETAKTVETETQGQKPAAAPTVTEPRQELLTKRKAQAEALGIDLRDIQQDEIDAQIAETETRIGQKFNEERKSVVYDDDTQNFIEEAEKGGLSPQFGWEGEKLGAFEDMLERNGIEADTVLKREQDTDVVPEAERATQLKAALDALNAKREQLREWNRLTADQKRVYLDNLATNELGQITPLARQKALEALNRYTAKKERTATGEVQGNREEGLYETQRTAYNKRTGLSLPPYSELTDAEKAKFKQDLKYRKKNGKTVDPTVENIDSAFSNLSKSISERRGAQKTDEKAALQEAELKSYKKAQAEIAAAQEQRKQNQRKAEEGEGPTSPVERIKRDAFIPSKAAEQVKAGNTENVLNYLRTQAKNKLHKAIAQVISNLKLKTKIKYVEKLPKGRLAEYDPKTDTILVTAEGMTDAILLHEFVHAATIKVLDQYEKGNLKGLTEAQIEAAEMLEDLMDRASDVLGDSYPDAFENLFEFVSYALTDKFFQEALDNVKLDVRRGGKIISFPTILPETKSAWSEFMTGVLNVLGLTKKMFQGQETNYEARNALLEVFQAFESIAGASTERIEREALPAKRIQAPPLPESVQKTVSRSPLPSTPKLNTIIGAVTTYQGRGNILKYAVNERIVLKRWQDGLSKAGKIMFGTDKSNAVYAAVLRSTGMSVDLFKEYGQQIMEDVQQGVISYAKAVGTDGAEALRRIGTVMVALHEPERRQTLFNMYVPLQNTTVDVKYPDGKTRSVVPAQVRKDIFRVLDQNKKFASADIKYMQDLLNTLVKDHVDPNGFSGLDPTQSEKRFQKKTDIKDGAYNVAGQSSEAELKEVLDTMYSPDSAGYKELNKVVEALKKAQGASQRMNKMANYWTQPVDNRVEFYGWQNYTPLRGKLGLGTSGQNDRIESQVEPMQLSTRMAQYEKGFFGRESEPDNTVLLVMSDMAKAAMRNGIREITKTTVNAINDGLMNGNTSKVIKFEDRHNFEPDVEQKTIFHYEPNGDIRIVKIADGPMAEAIKGTFKKANPLVDIPGTLTSFMGKTHTRYNLSFAPVDFIRNVLTNTGLIGFDMGPKASAKYLANIAGAVVTGGLRKSWVAGSLYESGNTAELEKLAGGNKPYEQLTSTQQYYRDTLDYIQGGGKISYLKGISSKSLQEEVEAQMKNFGFLKEPKTVEKFLNRYTDMFELATRVEAFRISRSDKYTELVKEKAPKTQAEKDALRSDAASYAIYYTKDLANFEQTGKWGNALAAWFMFWRPAATGAYRAIESVAPMFQDADYTMKLQLPRTVWDPESKKYDPQAVKKFKERHAEQKKNATIMVGLLGAMGVAVYSMAAALSDDDEMGRNKALVDDPSQWTRYARFHIPGFENPIRIPWGFGPGAFASAGAQLAMVAQGAATWGDALVNIWHVASDSFLPLPFSKTDPTENLPVWLIDSLTPAPLRPLVQFTINTDGLGRRIYNDTQSKYSNVFIAGFNIPEIYKDVAQLMYEVTGGRVEIEPNSLYFFATNYADGIVRPLATMSNLAMVAYGSKDFDSKTDLPVIGGFVGAKANVDGREFAKAEKEVLELRRRVDTLRDMFPERYADFIDKNPMVEAIIEEYNKNVNGELKKLRSEMKEISRMRDLTPKERNDIRKEILLMQNLEKRMMLDTFKAYGL